MKKIYLPLIAATLFVHVNLTSHAQDSARIAFTGMNPHVGQNLYFRVVDKSNNMEIGRTSVLLTGPNFTLGIGGIQAGSSYDLDFYADHNKNGRYDPPPTDHTWRISLDTIEGDTTVPFAHNTNFTDIAWVHQMTIALSSWEPHLDEDLNFALKTKSGTEIERMKLTPASGSFTVIFNGIIPDSSYNVDFYSDDNENGRYDPPPTDHAWRITLDSVNGDTVVPFVHNTIFTDIGWEYRLTIALSNMNPHLNQNLYFRLKYKGSGWEIERRKLLETVPNFNVEFNNIIPDSSYVVDFFTDHNKNDRYDPPSADHAWRITLDSVNGDTVVPFVHNTIFTDIGWEYRLTIALSNMNPHLNQNLYFRLKYKGSGWEIERRKLLETVPNFNVVFDNVMPDSSYVVDFFADHNKNDRYDPPNADHTWRITLDSILGDTTVPFVHNTNFTDIAWNYKLTVNFINMNPHVNQLFKLYLRNNESGAFIDSTVLDPITVADFSVNLFTIMPDSSYNVDFWADLSGNRMYEVPPADHAWRIELMDVRGDTVLDFTHNTDFTDIGLGVITGVDDIDRSGFSTYPNPARDELIIRSTLNDRNIIAVKIYSAAGGLVLNQDNLPAGPEVRINVSGLKPGMYIISVNDGADTKKAKFVKQ